MALKRRLANLNSVQLHKMIQSMIEKPPALKLSSDYLCIEANRTSDKSNYNHKNMSDMVQKVIRI